MNYLKLIFQKYTLLTSLFTCLLCVANAQIRLDVEGDAKIRGSIDLIKADGDSSVFIGLNAGLNDFGDNNNVFIGLKSGEANLIGSDNVFIGNKTGQNSTGGRNTFIGTEVGQAKSGISNTFVGYQSGQLNSGSSNAFFGRGTGKNNQGTLNTFIGNSSGSANTLGSANTFIGTNSGLDNTTGTANVFVGRDAGRITQSSTKSILLGMSTGALTPTDSLDRAIAIGYNAKVNCHNCAVIGGTGPDSVKVGIGTATPNYTLDVEFADGSPVLSSGNGLKLQNLGGNNHNWQFYVNNTTGNLEFYKNETFKGAFDNTTGQYTPDNSANGSQLTGVLDLQYTNADPSVYIGANIGNHLTSIGAFKRNTFIGSNAGQASTTGNNNTFIGDNVGFNSTTGFQNTFLGSLSGFNHTTGEKNTLIGYQAGSNISTGDENVYIGEEAGRSMSTSTRNTIIGTSAGPSPISGLDSLDKAIAIGYNARVNCHNCAVIGGTGADAVKVGIGTEDPIYDLDIHHTTGAPSTTPGNGLSMKNTGGNNHSWQLFIGDGNGKLRLYKNESIRGTFDEVSGNYTPSSDQRLKNNIQTLSNQLPLIQRLRPTTYHFNGRSTKRKVYGLIAQEVQKIIPDIVLENEPDNSEMKTLGISYTEFIPVLIAGIQEQQKMIQDRDKTVEDLAAQLISLENRLAKMEENTSNQLPTDNPILEELPIEQITLNTPMLWQNSPNPFTDRTQIQYFIPKGHQQAIIRVTNQQGQVVHTKPISSTGQGAVNIQIGHAAQGNYFYSLILDGQLFETKQMVIIK